MELKPKSRMPFLKRVMLRLSTCFKFGAALLTITGFTRAKESDSTKTQKSNSFEVDTIIFDSMTYYDGYYTVGIIDNSDLNDEPIDVEFPHYDVVKDLPSSDKESQLKRGKCTKDGTKKK